MKNVLTAFDKIFSENQKSIEASFHPLISLCKDMVNSQYWMFSSFAGLLQNPAFTGHGKNMKATFYAIHGNFFHFHAALYLTERGLFGSVGPLLRIVFEALLVAKYCSLSQDYRFFEHWEKGGIFEIKKGILAKVSSPEFREIPMFWEGLCRLSHSTIYAGQAVTSLEHIETEVSGTYSFLVMLLLCNYHLLNRHLLTNRIVYYIKRYDIDQEFPLKLRAARLSAKSAQTRLNLKAKRIVKEYSASWKL